MHVDRDEKSAKSWIRPVSLAQNFGFNATELRRVQSLVEGHEQALLEAWNEHFHP